MSLFERFFGKQPDAPYVRRNTQAMEPVRSLRYTIVEAATTEELAQMIQTLIGSGWHPLGGLAAFGGKVTQALLREDISWVPKETK